MPIHFLPVQPVVVRFSHFFTYSEAYAKKMPSIGINEHLVHHSFAHSLTTALTHKLNSNSIDVAPNSTNKVVILTFGDTKKSQFTIAKPILDQYGFKASFFITCSYANDRNPRYHLN